MNSLQQYHFTLTLTILANFFFVNKSKDLMIWLKVQQFAKVQQTSTYYSN